MPDWLMNEAIATYITTFVAGILVPVVGWLVVRWLNKRQQRKPLKYTILSTKRIFDIPHETINNLRINYKDGLDIWNLYQVRFRIINTSDKVITPLIVFFDESSMSILNYDVKTIPSTTHTQWRPEVIREKELSLDPLKFSSIEWPSGYGLEFSILVTYDGDKAGIEPSVEGNMDIGRLHRYSKKAPLPKGFLGLAVSICVIAIAFAAINLASALGSLSLGLLWLISYYLEHVSGRKFE